MSPGNRTHSRSVFSNGGARGPRLALDGGPADRATPWLSTAFVVLVLVGALVRDVPPVIRLPKFVLGTIFVGRFSYVAIRRKRVKRRNSRGR
ncbi:hypothetical protein EDD90_5918 [Streptomyces sp. Ag109_O5-1]|nr:hypothetical protein EDD90_5918 [Streptomyces sp. Ag109_O5-1]